MARQKAQAVTAGTPAAEKPVFNAAKINEFMMQALASGAYDKKPKVDQLDEIKDVVGAWHKAGKKAPAIYQALVDSGAFDADEIKLSTLRAFIVKHWGTPSTPSPAPAPAPAPAAGKPAKS